MRNAYDILVRKPEDKRPIRTPRHRWEDNIRMDLREMVGGVNWTCLAKDMEWRLGFCKHGIEC
jgi:hypothetical protein